ncbi:MAG: M20/M25/M40 family metallo-hydrolase, partial [Syntrophus sp. (in: bacteria)]
MIDEKLFERITRRIEDYEKDMIELQIELTAIPAIAPESGGDGEMKKAIFLWDFLERLGMTDLEIVDAPDERVSSGRRPNIIVRYPGAAASSTEQTWIISHMDIVPPGELGLWKQDPYHAYVEDGYIIGRGVVDNQQDLVASLFALKACLDEGIEP